MNKIKMGPQQFLIPKPVILAGTIIDGKPNFITVSWAGATSENPPTLSLAVRNTRYSLLGIKMNMTFSVNIPSEDMVKETDYCGTVSGSKFNKVKECRFRIFYGKVPNVPLIEQCPINIECEVYKILGIGDHSVVIGKIIETYISADCFTKDLPDINKINPLCFCTLTSKSMGYYKVGSFITHTKSIADRQKDD